MNTVLAALFLHFVGDFLLQSRRMATRKSKHTGALVSHAWVIWLVMLPFGFYFAVANAFLHGLQDHYVWRLYGKRFTRKGRGYHYWNDYWFYATIGFDQFLHAATLVVLLKWMVG